MGDKINLKLDARSLQGKKASQLRQQGIVPGVLYGQGLDTALIQVEYQTLEKVVRQAGKHTPVHVDVAGKKKIAMIKDVDRDPVRARIRHISLHAVKANEAVTAEVPIHLTGLGESPAEKAGFVVLQAIESVEVKARPADLPEALEVSVLELIDAENKLTFANVTLPTGVEYADAEHDAELVIANVYEPSALQAANEAAAGDAEADDAEAVEAEHDSEEVEKTEE